jgi:hypothetical protein
MFADEAAVITCLRQPIADIRHLSDLSLARRRGERQRMASLPRCLLGQCRDD